MSEDDEASRDGELLQAWRLGNQRAGNALLERHFDSLCRFFRSKVDSGVDDLIQRTLLRAVENHEKLREASSFRAYLFVVARNELVDSFKREAKRRKAFDPGLSSVMAAGPSQGPTPAPRDSDSERAHPTRE